MKLNLEVASDMKTCSQAAECGKQAAPSKHLLRMLGKVECPHLDMLRALQQPLIEPSCFFILLLLNLKVNIRFPQHLEI